MADLFNNLPIIGAVAITDGRKIFNGQPVRGVRVAPDGTLFTGGKRVRGIDVIAEGATIHNDGRVVGVAEITDGATIFNGADILPVSVRSGDFGGEVITPAAFANRVVSDAAWSWHLQKTAIYDATRKRIYCGAVSILPGTGAVGAQWVLEFDGLTGAYLTRHLVNSGYIADDHNAPALWIEGGRLLCGLCGHDEANEVKLARSTDTNPANLGAFTTYASRIGATTYSQFIKIGSTLYFAYRDTITDWTVLKNTAGGDPAQWTTPTALITASAQTYGAMRSTGASLAMLLWDHPTNPGSTRGYIKVAEKPDPMVGGVVSQATAVVLYTPPGASDSSRVLSVNDDATQFIYAKFVVGAEAATYHLARLTGASRTTPADWTHEDLGITTANAFYASSEYIAGGELIGSGAAATDMWVAYSTDAGHHFLERWTRASSADAWTKTRLAQSDRFMARPLSVFGAPEPMALVQDQKAYTSFTAFEMNAFTIVSNAPSDFGFFPNPGYPGELLTLDRFDAADGTLLSAHPSDDGTAWSVVSGAPAITSKRARFGGTGTAVAYLNKSVPADAVVAGQIVTVSAAGSSYIILRGDGTDQNFVQVGLNNAGAQGRGLYVHEFIGGTANLIANYGISTFAAGSLYRFVIEITGQQISVKVNGVERMTGTLASVLATGKIGIRTAGGGAALGFHIDDLGALDLAA